MIVEIVFLGSTYRNFKVIENLAFIFELYLLRIARFAHGVRQFIAAFNDGIYSVPPADNTAK